MKRILISITMGLALASVVAAQQPARTIAEIRDAGRRQPSGRAPRPLPLAGHWNLGEEKGGYTPEYQMKLIEQGHHLLPWFLMPNVYAHPEDPRWLTYYEAAIKRAARLQLPISLVSTQWEAVLSNQDEYLKLPWAQNPNTVTVEGQVRREVSPFGAVAPWRAAGKSWGGGMMMRKLQEWYPNPPLVLFISNNEHARLEWIKAEEDRRYVEQYGRRRDAAFKRKVVGDGWIERYRALQQGITEGLVQPAWKERAIYLAYDAFGPAHFARWPGWIEYSLYIPRRSSPWPLAWDGASPSFYLFNWSAITDFTVYSPQVESMNWVMMLEEAYRLNPDYWFELSTWDGHEPELANDKRKFYQRIGQPYTPERYGGMIQFGMWLLRPRVVREFRGYRETVAATEAWFWPIVRAVDRVHEHPVLREFWQQGTLVPNRARQHPYQTIVPEEYQKLDRWFLLGASTDPPGAWELGTALPVYSLALVKGTAPRRQWLVYAHAPAGDRQDVRVTIPEYGAARIEAPVAGAFFLVDERSRTVKRI